MALALIAGETPHLASQETGRATVLRHDQNGATTPDAMPSRELNKVREGDHLSIEYYAAQMFDVKQLRDVPTYGRFVSTEQHLDTSAVMGYFVYPEDPFLKYPNPASQIPTTAPGRSTFYLIANSAYRLHVAPPAQIDMPTDSAHYVTFYLKAVHHCYLPADKNTIGGSQGADAESYTSVAGRIGLPKGQNVLAFRNVLVTPPSDPNIPYLLIEAVKSEVIQNADTAKKLCGDAWQASIGNDFPKTVDHTSAVVLIKVTTDAGAPEVRYHVANKETTVRMDTLGGEPGAFVFDTPTLTAGHFDYQICYQTMVSQGTPPPTATASDHCIPAQPVSFTVNSPYPSPFRLQPGLIAVNRFRDVRLSAEMVFIINRHHYFGPNPISHPDGGLFNPIVGLQLGGSTNQVVLLAGLHLRVINEAGIVGGLRFGNDPSGTPWRITQNYFFGFSLDPALMTSLRSQSGS